MTPPTCCASLRPVRVLHGGHDRAGRGDPSLQGASSSRGRARAGDRGAGRPRRDDGHRLPARAHRLCHGHRRHRRVCLHARLELAGGLRHGPDEDLRDGAQLHALGGAALHPHGQLRHPRGHVGGAVPRRLHLHRPPARRPRHGHGVGVRRLRRHLRLLDRHHGHHGQGGLSVHEALRLCRPARRGHRRRRGHARHHDPAVDHHGDLRRLHRDQYRQALHGGDPARHPRRHPALPRDRVHDLAASPGARAARARPGASAGAP